MEVGGRGACVVWVRPPSLSAGLSRAWAAGRVWVPCGRAFTLLPVVSVSGGRSRLHLMDFGSCEGAPGRGGEAPGGPPYLSLSALGSVILALVSGAKHVPYR